MNDKFVVLKPDEEIPFNRSSQKSGWPRAVAEQERVFVPLDGRSVSYLQTARTYVSHMAKGIGLGHVIRAERDGVAGFYAWIELFPETESETREAWRK